MFILLLKIWRESNKMLLITKKVRMKSHMKNLNLNLSLGLNQSQNLTKNPLLKHWENWTSKNIK